MASENLRIFKGSNHHLWQVWIKSRIGAKGLHDVLTWAAIPSGEGSAEKLKQYYQARGLIVETLDSERLEMIDDQMTPKAILELFEIKYGRKKDDLLMALALREILKAKPEVGKMQEYFDRLDAGYAKARNLGLPVIPEKWHVLWLIVNLPDELDSVFGRMTLREDADYDLAKNRALVLAEEARITRNGSETEQEASAPVAMAAKAKTFKPKGRKEKLCYSCGKPGHFAADCRSKKNNDGRDSNKRDGFGALAQQHAPMALLSGSKASDSSRISFYIDSAATDHMCKTKSNFTDYEQWDNFVDVYCANGGKISAQGAGTLEVDTKFCKLEMKKVEFVDGLATNLLSVRRLTKKGKRVIFDGDWCTVLNENGSICMKTKANENDLYEVCFDLKKQNLAANLTRKVDAITWHRRLCHINAKKVSSMKSDHDYLEPCGELCEACILANLQKRVPRGDQITIKSSRPLELVHSDVMGPFDPDVFGDRYLITFVDDWSRLCHIRVVPKKSDVLEGFIWFVNRMKTQMPEHRICRLKTDNGLEYVNKEMREYIESRGIVHCTTAVDGSHQNGIAERKNRTLREKSRAMLKQSGMPERFWAEAAATANYTMNRVTSDATGQVPFERWDGTKPNLEHLRSFGCRVYVHNPRPRNKMDDRGLKATFLGYALTDRNYRVILEKGNITTVEAANCVFAESEFPYRKETATAEPEQNPEPEKVERIISVLSSDSEDEEENNSPPVRVSARKTKGKFSYDKFSYATGIPLNEFAPGPCLRPGESLPPEYDDPLFVKSMTAEIENMAKLGTYEWVDEEEGATLVSSRWVHDVKREENCKPKRRSRLVARGFTQKKGINYYETYANVADVTSIRLFLTMAAKLDYELYQIDVKSAFLNANLDEEVLMIPPPGFRIPGKVWKLRKSVYGLKQASKNWEVTFANFLKSIGFQRFAADKSVFRRGSMYIVIYVDDIMLAGPKQKDIDDALQELKNKFPIHEMGQPKRFLNINITRDRSKRIIYLDQTEYIDTMLDRFHLKDVKPSDRLQPFVAVENSKSIDQKEIEQKLGALQYLACRTRPDIMYIVNRLAQETSNATEHVRNAVTNVFRYLKATRTQALVLGSVTDRPYEVYVDASHGQETKSRSRSGMLVKVFGASIHWSTNIQKIQALSTAEAELNALTNAMEELAWINPLVDEFGIKSKPVIHEDNQAVLSMIEKPRTKKYKLRADFVKDRLDGGEVSCLSYKPTNEQAADALTKVIGKDAPRLLGLMDRSSFCHPGVLMLAYWSSASQAHSSTSDARHHSD